MQHGRMQHGRMQHGHMQHGHMQHGHMQHGELEVRVDMRGCAPLRMSLFLWPLAYVFTVFTSTMTAIAWCPFFAWATDTDTGTDIRTHARTHAQSSGRQAVPAHNPRTSQTRHFSKRASQRALGWNYR